MLSECVIIIIPHHLTNFLNGILLQQQQGRSFADSYITYHLNNG